MATGRKFSEREQLTFQRKLSNFLHSYRTKNDLQAKELAAFLGYDQPRYSKLEHPSVPFKRFIGALEFLYTIISVDPSMTLAEFANKLEGTSNRGKNNLRKWEMDLLKIFDKVSTLTLNNFTRLATHSHPKDPNKINNKLDSMLRLMEAVKDLDEEDIDGLRISLLAIKKKPFKSS